MRPSHFQRLPLILFAASLCGCGLQKPRWITYEDAGVSPAETVGERAAPVVRAATRLSWTTPDGWRAEAGTGMRAATFTLGADGQSATCTVIMLSGPAGGVDANVKRWIGQLKLEPLTDSDFQSFMDRQPQVKTSAGLDLRIVDITELGDGAADAQSIIGGILNLPASTAFIKFMGPSGLLRGEKDKFIALCQSMGPES